MSKVTIEPPKGLKNKLLTAFGTSGLGEIAERIYMKEDSNLGWRRLLFSLCLFNAVIQERNKYDALGWNLPYEFTSSDLEVGSKVNGSSEKGRFSQLMNSSIDA